MRHKIHKPIVDTTGVITQQAFCLPSVRQAKNRHADSAAPSALKKIVTLHTTAAFECCHGLDVTLRYTLAIRPWRFLLLAESLRLQQEHAPPHGAGQKKKHTPTLQPAHDRQILYGTHRKHGKRPHVHDKMKTSPMTSLTTSPATVGIPTSSELGVFVLVEVERAHAQLARVFFHAVQVTEPLRNGAEIRPSVHVCMPALRNQFSQILWVCVQADQEATNAYSDARRGQNQKANNKHNEMTKNSY